MQRRTALSFTLTKRQKDALLEHSIWSVDSLSREEKEYVFNELSIGRYVESRTKIIHRETKLMNYSSGFESVDKYVSPYIAGCVTEIAGMPGSGRTTLCLKYAANLPNDKKVLWIDTEGCLVPPKGLTLTVLRVMDHLQFFALARQIPKLVREMGDSLGLIVVDSIAAPLRGQAAEATGERTSMLWEISKALREVACERGIAVLVTNHLSMRMFHGGTRTLGESWSHVPTHALEVKKYGLGDRIIKVIKSPCIPRIDIGLTDNSDVV